MTKNLFTPNVLTINILVSGPMKLTPQQVNELLSPLGTILNVSSTPMVFDGTSLVPAPVEAVIEETPVAAPVPKTKKGGLKPGTEKEAARKVQTAQATARTKANSEKDSKPKTIQFEEGSDPHKIWQLIQNGPALTSTQIREKLSLGSNIVNTTVYRLKNAGMIRPMSYPAPNGDTLYTSTEFDPKPATEVSNDEE